MMPDVDELRSDFLLFNERDSLSFESPVKASVAIGAFDGFHVGHRELVHRAVEDARSRGVACVVVTFDPDPDNVVGPRPALRLTSTPDRLGLLAASGADGVFVVPFTQQVAAMDLVHFFEEVLSPALEIVSIHVGNDFRLGRGGSSTVSDIGVWARRYAIDVYGHDLVQADGSTVSATRIRSTLVEGHVETATSMLGRRYMGRGRVVHGRHEGSSMGFPTANIEIDQSVQIPADGAYSGLVLAAGSVYPAAVNVGVPPMFADSEKSAHLEANLIGFSGDLYGSEISLAFGRRLREPRVFSDREELIRTVLGNIQDAIDDFGSKGVSIL